MGMIAAAGWRLVTSAVWPWLAVTRQHLKITTLVVIGFVLLAFGTFVALRLIGRLRRAAAKLDEPVELEPVDAHPPVRRVVDSGIANLLEQAAPIDGDERSDEELFAAVVRVTVEVGGVSIPALQRRLHLDFARASAFVERMVEEEMLLDGAPGGKLKLTEKAQEYLDRLART